VLCRELGCRNDHLAFEASKHGKPSALVSGRPAPISFNVSHSRHHGLIALAPGGRVGVDVEERIPHPNFAELIAAVFGPNEQRELAKAHGLDRLHLFFRLWTMKEALSKAHGTGLSLDVSRFEVPMEMRAGRKCGSFRFPDSPDDAWKLNDIGTDRFAAALAYEQVGP
jgi:4'-phosphopantetheinyl transferase